MGMYTELFFRAEVDEDAYRVFRQFKKDGTMPPETTHEFFGKGRAPFILGGSHGSYYFPGACGVTLETDTITSKPIHWVSLRANLKNYEGEIESFLDWVMPHVLYGGGTNDLVGWSLYEEADEPTLHYKRKVD